MQLYAILRRNGWQSHTDLAAATGRSTQVGDEEMSYSVRWIRSYVLNEGSDKLGMLCLYEARDEEAVREHAARAGMPVDEIIPVTDTVVMRPDPQPAWL
jgi:hypothetical protein